MAKLLALHLAFLSHLLLLLPAPSACRYCLSPWRSEAEALSATLYKPGRQHACGRLQAEPAAFSAAACTTRIHAATRINMTACFASRTRVLLLLTHPGAALPPQQAGALPLYHVRAVGASGVWRERVVHCSGRLALAALDLTTPGSHSIEVLLQAPAFSFCNLTGGGAALPTPTIPPEAPPIEPWLGFLAVEVAQEVAAAEAAAGAKGYGADIGRLMWSSDPPILVPDLQLQQQPTRQTSHRRSLSNAVREVTVGRQSGPAGAETGGVVLPACNGSGLLPGRWEFKQWPAAEADALTRTCVWAPKGSSQMAANNCSRPLVQFDAAASSLHWQPTGCSLAPTATIRPPAACLPPGRKLCTLGDSHSRYLAYAFDAWVTNYTNPADMDCRSWDKVPPVSEFAAFYSDAWAKRQVYPDGHFDNCSVLVANTGHWPASFQTRGHPKGIEDYRRDLRAWAAAVLAPVAARGHTRVLYALSVAAPTHWRRFVKQDWRYNSVLEMYNLKAVEVAAEMGFPVVDFWGMTASLPEGAWDSSHYFWRGAVGSAMLNVVLNAACL